MSGLVIDSTLVSTLRFSMAAMMSSTLVIVLRIDEACVHPGTETTTGPFSSSLMTAPWAGPFLIINSTNASGYQCMWASMTRW